MNKEENKIWELMENHSLDEIEAILKFEKAATENLENRFFWLMGMGYSLSQIELILLFDGFFVDGYVYNECN